MAGEHRPPLTPLPIPLTKDHHCCKKTAHGRRSRFLHKLLRGNDGNSEVGEPKCHCPAPEGRRGRKKQNSRQLSRDVSTVGVREGVAVSDGSAPPETCL